MFRSIFETIFGEKVGKTRVVPLATKIIVIFALFMLVSNFASNYLNLMFNRTELVKLMKQLLVKDLKEMHSFCNSQREIFEFSGDESKSVEAIETKALGEFKNEKSVLLGIKDDGGFLFQASKIEKVASFPDIAVFEEMNRSKEAGKQEGAFSFRFNNEEYFGIYKYNDKWNIFILRGEELKEFYADSRRIFRNIGFIIFGITLLSAIVGITVVRYITRFIHIITRNIMDMTESQKLDIIDLKGAPNDDITFLGMAFNSLAGTINNLLVIFRKFVNQDIAIQAYRDREVKLEGTQKELAMLFSDIKSFTFITEMLGTDIIKLLNMHYDRAIRQIIKYNGVIGSIIGDALLAVYGVMDSEKDNKSYEAVMSAYKVQEVAASLRAEMYKIREEIMKKKGSLTEVEENVYKAVLIEVGCGIDGGMVFYGNIGSYERMTNTVIGDNVNSASRLEGLTREYKVPVICSEYIKDDIEEHVLGHGITFVELDTVQVKGKTIGKKVYWPVLEGQVDEEMTKEIEIFSKGRDLYYEGKWEEAFEVFSQGNLALSDAYKDRISGESAPDDWDGIWKMKTK